ncbi:hypothetical protein E2320_003301 [Naja naja]|nr:hypothetical protein E2320_003301 [Naja naja]
MDSLKILTTLTMVFWLPSGCYASSEGPKTWISLGHCNGKKQSPINIIPRDASHNPSLGPVQLVAKSFHLHWGAGASRPGSEHQIDGKPYSMELHVVHTRNNMSMSDAVKDPKGIAVLAFFIERCLDLLVSLTLHTGFHNKLENGCFHFAAGIVQWADCSNHFPIFQMKKQTENNSVEQARHNYFSSDS